MDGTVPIDMATDDYQRAIFDQRPYVDPVTKEMIVGEFEWDTEVGLVAEVR